MTGRKEFRSQMQESEQQLENLVRELKAAPASHNPVMILLANHVTARCRNSEQQLVNLVREFKAAPANHMPVRILLANHVTARCRIQSSSLRFLSFCRFLYLTE
jgi:hypothetical protein